MIIVYLTCLNGEISLLWAKLCFWISKTQAPSKLNFCNKTGWKTFVKCSSSFFFFSRMSRQPCVSPRSFPHTILTTPVLLTKCLGIEASGNVEVTTEISAEKSTIIIEPGSNIGTQELKAVWNCFQLSTNTVSWSRPDLINITFPLVVWT